MAKKPLFFDRIDELRQKYASVSKGRESLIQVLNEAEIPEHVYNSNAIEDSTLTLEETEKILLQIDLDRYITEREIFEAKNLARVMAYITESIEKKKETLALANETLLLLHKMLIANIRDEIAGRFRAHDEWVRVGTHIAPAPHEVSERLKAMWQEFRDNKYQHIVKRIAALHLAFEYTHPFVDGNGRIGRVLNNLVLVKEGYVPINIAFANRARYYEAFKEFERKEGTSIMEEIIGRALLESYHKRLAYAGGKRIITLNEYAKIHRQSHSNLINKAVRQTIPAFREKGIWKIGATH